MTNDQPTPNKFNLIDFPIELNPPPTCGLDLEHRIPVLAVPGHEENPAFTHQCCDSRDCHYKRFDKYCGYKPKEGEE